MKAERLIWLLAVLALGAAGWWLSANTEWVEEDQPRGAQGEARENPTYAAEQLLRGLGMSVAHKEALDTMPPPQARLVLLSNDWELMPQRAEQLQQWVKAGGHLVLMQPPDWSSTVLFEWVPIYRVSLKLPDKDESKPTVPAQPSSQPKRKSRSYWQPRPLTPTETASTPPLWGTTEWVAACAGFDPERALRARRGHDPSWTLTLVEGTRATRAVLIQQDQALQVGQERIPSVQALRVPIGNGSVTVINSHNFALYNDRALSCENPLLLAGAVQAEPGATVWVYLQEKREALLPWLWHGGWIAIVLGGLALAAWLWRATVRFGPRLAPAPRLRRSISEQVRGLASYLHGSGREALLAAQQRALTEQAARRVPRFSRLPATERAQAIAQVTGLGVGDLSTALAARFCTRAELSQHLQVLEAARRRLR